MARWIGYRTESETFRSTFPLLASIIDSVFDVVGVHTEVYDRTEGNFLGLFSKNAGIRDNEFIIPPETREKQVDIALIGNEGDIELLDNVQPLLRILDKNGRIVIEVYERLNGSFYVAMADVWHRNRSELEPELIRAFKFVLESMGAEKETNIINDYLNKQYTKKFLELVEKLSNVSIKEIVVEKYVPDIETLKIMTEELVRLKTLELEAENAKLQTELENLKKEIAIPDEVMRTFEKMFKNGWKFARKTAEGYIFEYHDTIKAQYVLKNNTLYSIDYPENDLPFIEGILVYVSPDLKQIIKAEALWDFDHPNVLPFEDDDQYGSICLGELGGAPLSKIFEIPEMLKTVNLDSSYDSELTDKLENDIAMGRLRRLDGDIVWNVQEKSTFSVEESPDSHSEVLWRTEQR